MEPFSALLPRAQAPLPTQPFHRWTLPDGSLWAEFHRHGDAYLLRFLDLADFSVAADGYNVECHPAPGVSEATYQHLYLNQVQPLMLSQQGRLVFHASAVDIGDGAIAFIGVTGRGKSTLAASFAAAGCRFLTDDGLVVEQDGGACTALPSHPSIRLWADSEQALIAPGATTAPAVSFTDKSRFLADETLAFCAEPRPLRRAYFLADGSADAFQVQRLSATEALPEWVKHSFLLDIEAKSRIASHFKQTAALVGQVLSFRLDFPRRFDDLADVREAILRHALTESAAA